MNVKGIFFNKVKIIKAIKIYYENNEKDYAVIAKKLQKGLKLIQYL